MKIAIVTDAWRPQTNGVVQTLSTTAQTLRAGGHDVLRRSSRTSSARFPVRPIRKSASRGFRIGALAQLLSDFAPDCIHIATEGTLGMAARTLVRAQPFRVHDVVSHAVSRVRAGARADSARAELRASAALSFGRGAHDGRDADDAETAGNARFSQHRALDARRRRGAVQARRQAVPGFAAADLRCTWDASRSRRTSRRFSRSTCRARSSSSATGRSARSLQAKYPGGAVRRLQIRRGARGASRRRRRVRVSEPHRHVRSGAARSAGVRRAGRCVSGDRSDRRRSRTARPACSTKICAQRRWPR